MRVLVILFGVMGTMLFLELRADSKDSSRHTIVQSEVRDPDGNVIILNRKIISHSTQPAYSLASYEETTYFGEDRTKRKDWTRGMIELTEGRRRIFDMVTETFNFDGQLETRFIGSFEHGEKKGIWEQWAPDGSLRSRTLEFNDVTEQPPPPRQRRGRSDGIDATAHFLTEPSALPLAPL